MWHEDRIDWLPGSGIPGQGPGYPQSRNRLIQAIANQAATAIINAKLFEEVTIARNRPSTNIPKVGSDTRAGTPLSGRELHDEIGGLLTSFTDQS